jgi:hypothetical protein
MKKFLWALLLMVFGVWTQVVAQVTLTPIDALAFDYLDANLTSYQVSEFQAQWDGGTWIALSPTPFRDAQTISGGTSYKVPPPFTNGNHSVSFRACNTIGCGAGSAVFPFAYAAAEVPQASPGNVRKVVK